MTRWGWAGRAALCVALAGVGAMAAFYEVTMSMDFWRGLAMSKEGAESLAMSAIALSAFAALFSFAGGTARRIGFPVIGWLVVFAAVIFTAYNVTSVMGFQLKERVGRVLLDQAKAEKAEKKAVETRDDAKSTRAEQLSWLRATYAGTPKKDKDERDRLLSKIEAIGSVALPSAVSEAEPVIPDLQAAVFANMLASGSQEDIETVQTRMIGAFALLLGVGVMLAFWLSGLLWPGPVTRPAAPAAAMPVVPVEAAEGKGVDRPTANPITFPGAASEHRGRGRSITQADRDLVSEFIREARAVAKPGARCKAEEVHQWFGQWANAGGHPSMTLTRFGRIVAELDPTIKINDGRNVLYMGLAQPAYAITKLAA